MINTQTICGFLSFPQQLGKQITSCLLNRNIVICTCGGCFHLKRIRKGGVTHLYAGTAVIYSIHHGVKCITACKGEFLAVDGELVEITGSSIRSSICYYFFQSRERIHTAAGTGSNANVSGFHASDSEL